MVNRLAASQSPYLLSHAGNPVDWYPWGADAFSAARERDVPVLISLGYSTCHWCHVMARESFSDPELVAYLNERFVAVKVDREEHPDVDASYLAAAGAFTAHLGWPLNVFATPDGRAFHAGTYSPPLPMAGQPSFRQVLTAVSEAWQQRRAEVEAGAGRLAAALQSAAASAPDDAIAPLTPTDRSAITEQLLAAEDREFGGFGTAPKFPATPALLLAQTLGDAGTVDAGAFAARTLATMAGSALRDPVDGGFFRYATRRDWTEPHYERMLYDNALLLEAYAAAGDSDTAAGIVRFLTSVLQLDGGGFASAQDSESELNGQRSEGGYYALSAVERRAAPAPKLDRKLLTGWNGLAIGALADAGSLLGERDWVDLARSAADRVLAVNRDGGRLLRASLDGTPSAAAASLEDYGMLADGLLRLAVASGEVQYASTARGLVDDTLAAGTPDGGVFGVPGGGDPTLNALGLALPSDLNEGAYPSGISALASAARRLHLLTGQSSYRDAAVRALGAVRAPALAQPIAFGSALSVLTLLAAPIRQLVLVGEDTGPLRVAGRGRAASLSVITAVTDSQADRFAAEGFELYAARSSRSGVATAYYCEDFVCQLPVTDPAQLLLPD